MVYRLEDRIIRVRFSVRARDSFKLHSLTASSGTHPDSYQMLLSRFSPGIKRARREVDHLTPSVT